MKKRMISLLLVMLMVLSALPVSAMAANDAKPEKITLVGSETALDYEAKGYLSFWGTDVPLYEVSVPFGTETVSLYDSGTYIGSYGSGYTNETAIQSGDLEYWTTATVGSASPYTIETRMDGSAAKNLAFVKLSNYVGSAEDGYVLRFVGVGDPSNAPVITADLSTEQVTYTYGDTAAALSVTATGDATVTYQWQMSTTSATEGFVDIDGATTASYTPGTLETGSFWYRVVVTNQETGKSKASVTSAVTPVVVNAPEGQAHVVIKTSIGYTASRPLIFTLKNNEGETVELPKDTSTGFAVYDFWAAPGEYTYTAADPKDAGVDPYTLGTGTITVADSTETQNFEFYILYVYASISGWTGKDFTTTVVRKSDGTEMTPGDPYKFASYVGYPYFMAPDTYTYQIKPSDARAAEGYQPTAVASKVFTATKTSSTCYAKPTQLVTTTFTVPKDAELKVTTAPSRPYAAGTAQIPATTDTSNADKDVYTYTLTAGTSYIYRATGAGQTVAALLAASSSATAIDLVSDMTGGSPSYIDRTKNSNGTQTADLRLNGVDYTGSLSLTTGGTKQLTPLRMWQIANSATANNASAYAVEPDFHYTVVDAYGNSSDVVTVSENGLITAKKAGTAIILVTYDAITVKNWGWKVNADKTFSAIWPENTGVVVVTVGSTAGSGTGMTINTANANNTTYKTAGANLDAELDVLYYVGDAGYDYTFTPAAGSTVTLLRPTLSETAMTYSGGFGTTGVTVNEDGSVTLNMTEGKNIVKVTNASGSASYQVVTVKKAAYTVENVTNPGLSIVPGNTVKIVLDEVYAPANYMAYLYNFYNQVTYTKPGGTTLTGTKLSSGNRYQFDGASGDTCRTFQVTIPSDWQAGKDYVLTGGTLSLSGNGKALGYHHTNTLNTMASTMTSNTSKLISMGALPDIVIPVAANTDFSITMELKDENGSPLTDYTVVYTFNGETVTATNSTAAILGYGTWDYVVCKDGYLATRGTLALNESSARTQTLNATAKAAALSSTWDGLSSTQPKVVGGVYQIGTGAELNWFMKTVNSGTNTISAVLTGDIDLADYDWTPIGNTSVNYKGVFDGQGHKLYNLHISVEDTSNVGLFGYVSGYQTAAGAAVRNLTVESGSVTIKDTKSASGSYTSLSGFGSIVGRAEYGVTIENCVNKADMNVTVYSVLAIDAGGVVGYINDDVTVKNCGNYGNITSMASGMVGYGYGGRIGGVVGSINRTSTVSGCFNTGNITSTGTAGGIIGYVSGSSLTFTDLYNTGSVTGGAYVGGLAGYLGSNAISAGYSTVVPTAESTASADTALGGIAGCIGSNGSLSRTYYNSSVSASIGKGTASSDTSASKTQDEIRALTSEDLSAAFLPGSAAVNDGYPTLLWQADIQNFRLASLPVQTSYCQYQTLDITGLVAMATVNGTETTLDNSLLNITPTLLDTAGTQAVTVSFGGSSATFDVNVRAITPDDITIETTIVDGQERKGSRMTFDVIAQMPDGSKISASDVTVTLNGTALSVAWDDSIKTSYSAIFTTEGVNTIAISVFGGVKTASYTINYIKAAPGEVIGQAVFSLEAFSLGGGYIIEPQMVDIKEGENAAQLLLRVLDEYGFTYSYTGSPTSGFYLSHIKGSQLASVDSTGNSVPQVIKDRLGNSLKARTDETSLGEFDHANGSGWMYCVNNVFPNVGYSSYYLADGDVIRTQFTLALGSDIGGGYSTGDPNYTGYYPIGNKDELTTLMAKREMVVTQAILDVATKVNATEEEVQAAVADLKAANTVEELIDAIGSPVTLESKTEIDTARAAYDALTDAQKALVRNYRGTLQAAEDVYDGLVAAGVDSLIDAIGTPVTLESKGKIETARTAYDTLSNAQKNKVTKYAILQAAESEYADLTAAKSVDNLIDAIGTVTLESKTAIEAARAAYDALTDAQKNKVTKYELLQAAEREYADLTAAKNVNDLIDTIGTVTLESKANIDAARAAYDALTDDQKALFASNYPDALRDLEAAEARYAELVAQAEQAEIDRAAADGVIGLIDAIGGVDSVTRSSGPAIRKARNAYDALTDAQKALVTNYDELVACEKAFAEIPDPVLPPVTPSKPSTTTPTAPAETVRYTDVAKSDWFYDSVLYVSEKSLMTGTGANSFSPNVSTTRGMIVTILARLEGVDTTKGGTWYEAGQKWAMENGIADGTNMTGEMTREQLATILYRYAKTKGYDVSKSNSLGSFTDSGKVSDWALEAMQWANAEGLINGKGAGLLDPQGKATRAETAAILMRFMKNVAKLDD